MKKLINFFILAIFSCAVIGMILYIAVTGKDLLFAKYVTAITALFSLWYTIIQSHKNEKEKGAKVLVELAPHYIWHDPHIRFAIKNNSNFSLTNMKVKFSRDLFFDDKNLENEINGLDIGINGEHSWVLDTKIPISNKEKIKYTLFFYDLKGKKKKIKGKILNRL